jgi:ParB family chromosome partitioning protein
LKIALSKIDPDPNQPRKLFKVDELESLAASILANGLLQPIIVRKGRGVRYIIIAGERRWRAHCLLRDSGAKRLAIRFASIECIVRKTGGAIDVKVKQIVENVARADMTILEEADAFGDLVKLGMTEDEIAAKLGLAVFRVRWRLMLLNLAPTVRKMVAAEQLDKQQAMEVARLESHADQARIVRMINRNELSGWKAVRNAVDAIVNGATQADIFGEMAPLPKAQELAIVRSMEKKVEEIAKVVAMGWKDGECVVASKVAPDRAMVMAQKLAGIKAAIAHMERELRNMSGQAKIVMMG